MGVKGFQQVVYFVGHLALTLVELGFKPSNTSFLRFHKLRHQSFKIIGTTISVRRIVVESTVCVGTVLLKTIRWVGRISLRGLV